MISDSICLHTRQQSQAIDQFAITQAGIPSYLLMKRAAFFSWQIIKEHSPQNAPVWVLCGTGNNAGDGLFVAQYAKLAAREVRVYRLNPHANFQQDAQKALDEWLEIDTKTYPISCVIDDLQRQDGTKAPILVDAIFGTGLNRPVSDELNALFAQLNTFQLDCFAIDTPSGLDVNTGNLFGAALNACATLSFLTQKFGFYCNQGPDVCGHIYYSDLGLSKDAPEALNLAMPIAKSHNVKVWQNQLSQRPKNAHKGTSGSCLLIGGNDSMSGAILLASQACLNSGVGLCKTISKSKHHFILTGQQPEIMCFTKNQLPEQLKSTSAVVFGPGLGQNTWAQKIWKTFWQEPSKPPMVLDADALNLLAKMSDTWLSKHKTSNWILTPHPAEAARLLKCTTSEIQQDRIHAIQTLQQRYGGVIILKGNGSLIFDGQQMELCRAGNPGMATGGMGDVLSGMIGAFLAQGMTPFSAACLGVWLHAETADSLYGKHPKNHPHSVLPSRLAKHLSVF